MDDSCSGATHGVIANSGDRVFALDAAWTRGGSGGGEASPPPVAAGRGREGRTSLATSAAAAQLLSMRLSTCAFPRLPAVPQQLSPGPQHPSDRRQAWWTPTSSLQNVGQEYSEGKRTSAFSAFPSLATMHSRTAEAWHAGCPLCKERLPKEASGEPRPSSPHLQTRCSAHVAELTSSAFRPCR